MHALVCVESQSGSLTPIPNSWFVGFVPPTMASATNNVEWQVSSANIWNKCAVCSLTAAKLWRFPEEGLAVFLCKWCDPTATGYANRYAVDRRCKHCSKDDTEPRYISELGASARLCERCAPSVTEILGCLVRVQGGGACTNCSARNALCACKRCTEQHLKTTVCCLRCILDAGSTSTCACPTVFLYNVD